MKTAEQLIEERVQQDSAPAVFEAIGSAPAQLYYVFGDGPPPSAADAKKITDAWKDLDAGLRQMNKGLGLLTKLASGQTVIEIKKLGSLISDLEDFLADWE
jgi:hypothetical protein